jgi:hypothetical protein
MCIDDTAKLLGQFALGPNHQIARIIKSSAALIDSRIADIPAGLSIRFRRFSYSYHHVSRLKMLSHNMP